MLASGLVAPAKAAEPTTPDANPYFAVVNERPLGFRGYASLVVAGDRLFVTDHYRDRVLVLGADGAVVATVENQPGAYSIAASPDGRKVYVGVWDAISVLDAVTATETDRINAGRCIGDIAHSSGRLYYPHGCSTDLTAGIASVDPAAPETPPVDVLPRVFRGAKLVGTADHLVAATTSGQYSITTFSTAADGSVTQIATVPAAAVGMSVSPDGTRLVTAANQVKAYTLPSLEPAGEYAGETGAYAVAVSPDGSRVFVAADHSGTSLRMYDAGSKALLWHRYRVKDRHYHGWELDYSLGALSNVVAFSPDGGTVYAMNGRNEHDDVTLFRSRSALGATSTSFLIDTPYNRPVQARVRVAGAATGTVRIAIRLKDGDAGTIGTAALSNGAATKSLTIRQVGDLETYYLGDLAHASSISNRFTFRHTSRLSVAMVGTNKLARGVHRYASSEDVRARVRLEPKLSDQDVVITLWKWRKGKWVQRGSQQLRTDRNSRIVVVFAKRVGGRLCFTAFYGGDANQAQTGVVGPPFSMAK